MIRVCMIGVLDVCFLCAVRRVLQLNRIRGRPLQGRHVGILGFGCGRSSFVL